MTTATPSQSTPGKPSANVLPAHPPASKSLGQQQAERVARLDKVAAEKAAAKGSAEVVAGPRGEIATWIIDRNGKHDARKSEPGSYAGKIVVYERASKADPDKLAYTATAYLKEAKGAFKLMSPTEDKEREAKSSKDAFEHAWAVLDRVIQGLYIKALEENDEDGAIAYNRLRYVSRDQSIVEALRLKSSKRVWFTYPDKAQQLQFQKFLRKHFPKLDELAPIVFRFRHETTGEERTVWSGKKDESGNPVCIPSRAEKCSKKDGETLRLIPEVGYAPFFIITICAELWEKSSAIKREGFLWSALDTCKLREEEAWVASRFDVAALIRAFGTDALFESQKKDLEDLVTALKGANQLELFAGDFASAKSAAASSPLAASA